MSFFISSLLLLIEIHVSTIENQAEGQRAFQLAKWTQELIFSTYFRCLGYLQIYKVYMYLQGILLQMNQIT